MPFTIPARLAAHSQDRGDWLAALPDTVAALAERWPLRLGTPFEPGGETAWVAPAGDGLVLKVGWAHDEARDEGAGLRAWAERGAVQVLAEHTEGRTAALLLERATPGTPLTALPGQEQDVVLVDLLRRLWIEPPHSTRSARCRRCATPGSPRPSPSFPVWTPGSSVPASHCSGRCRATTSRSDCCRRTCTRRTCSARAASRG